MILMEISIKIMLMFWKGLEDKLKHINIDNVIDISKDMKKIHQNKHNHNNHKISKLKQYISNLNLVKTTAE